MAVIPARGGSKGIPLKNLASLNDRPLIAHTIDSALKANIDEIVVSTDNNQIAKISEESGVKVINRPDNLSHDRSSSLEAIQHAVDFVKKYELIVTLQPTSPLRNQTHIDEAIDLISKDDNADSLVSVTKVAHNMVPESIMKINSSGYLVDYLKQKTKVLRRQDKKRYFARNGAAIYITKYEKIQDYVFGGKIIPYYMNEIESIDIDSIDDLLIAELYLKHRK